MASKVGIYVIFVQKKEWAIMLVGMLKWSFMVVLYIVTTVLQIE